MGRVKGFFCLPLMACGVVSDQDGKLRSKSCTWNRHLSTIFILPFPTPLPHTHWFSPVLETHVLFDFINNDSISFPKSLLLLGICHFIHFLQLLQRLGAPFIPILWMGIWRLKEVNSLSRITQASNGQSWRSPCNSLTPEHIMFEVPIKVPRSQAMSQALPNILSTVRYDHDWTLPHGQSFFHYLN